MMVFEQNPENNFSTSGTVRGGSENRKVLVCGDLFAKVSLRTEPGYVSLSEIVNPQEMMGFYPVTAPDMVGSGRSPASVAREHGRRQSGSRCGFPRTGFVPDGYFPGPRSGFRFSVTFGSRTAGSPSGQRASPGIKRETISAFGSDAGDE